MTRKKKVKVEIVKECLRKVPYFGTLTEDELTLLAAASYRVTKKARELIVHSGEEATQFFFLESGVVVTYYLKPNGKRFITQTHTEGSLVFVSLALAQTRFGGYVETLEETTYICIPSALTLRLVKINSEFAQGLLHLTINDNLHLNDTVNNFLVDARTRFCRFLLRRALESGEDVEGELKLDLGLSKGDVAAVLDMTPETLSRTIAQMKGEQVIDVENAIVTIKDLRGLVRISENL